MEDILKKTFISLAAAALALAGCGQGVPGGGAGGDGAARQQIRIVGSSTVYPFTQAVAERFNQGNPNFGAPIVESTGSGAGLQLFCAGVGAGHPDITNSSRRIKPSELELCNRNGVQQVIELPVGIDGLALVESATRATGFQLTARDVYAALAANPFGRAQTARTWQDVNPALPAVRIQVYGPPPTSGTRDSFAELILEKGCDSDPEMKALKEQDSNRHKTVCTQIREDGAFIEAGENDNLLMQRVAENQGAIGVLGFSFLEENRDRVRGIAIGGVEPSSETIQNFTYPGARQMFIYVKGEHLNVIPGLREFLQEYARGWEPGGYLAQRGLIPSPDNLRTQAAQQVQNPTPLTAANLQ
ncbi:MAG: substrate-binding domain-containing protein [Allosphingosinicella sp.]|uniref:substrate-binding domain-containing protein n=1 Tax=Allosphingosinicella sp. TaxID=2823234 RepID=UPI003931B1B2